MNHIMVSIMVEVLRPHCAHSQEAEKDVHSHSAHFLLFVQSRTTAHGMVAPVVKGGLHLTSHRHTQRSPDLDKPSKECTEACLLGDS